MKIAPQIAADNWKQAAVEQLAADLRDQGYQVEREVEVEGANADLIARRGDEVILFEVKVPGSGDPAWLAPQVARMQAAAKKLGARFRLIIVRLPHQTSIRIDGLEAALEGYLAAHVPEELKKLSAGATVLDVDGIQFRSLIYANGFEVEGDGDILVSLPERHMDVNLPFAFRGSFQARVDDQEASLRVNELQSLKVDTSYVD